MSSLADHHARVGRIFLESCELPEDQREAFLQQACQGDPSLLREVRDKHVPSSRQLLDVLSELKATHEQLWDIEDAVRELEAASDFSDRFVQKARAVYETNDKRAHLKKRINQLLNSDILEEKSYGAQTQ